MVDDTRILPTPAAYRGFLFSDMRGFTAFAERHGNAAAAAAVGKFLVIARTAIARHDGAEIKTEGDAIHAVFPSASSAVLCGLDIVDAAAELNAREPGRPLGLGVGIHAGEAVETAEGYIGRAVNIAARLCAAAKPGEVLVSSTVKGITQASIPVGFIPRGRRRLKGIEDPIVVYAVTRDTTARGPGGLPRVAVLGGIGLAAVVLAVLAVLAGPVLQSPTASPSASLASSAPAVATHQPVVMGPLAVGTYATSEFEPAFTFDILDEDWVANRDFAGMFGLTRNEAPVGSVYFLRVSQVVSNPCVVGVEGEAPPNGPSAVTLLIQLEALGHLSVSERRPVEVGGHAGQQVDVTVDQDALARCGGLVGAEVPVFVAGEEVWGASTLEWFRVISVGVDEESVTIVLSTDWAETQSVNELEALFEVGRNLLGTVEF